MTSETAKPDAQRAIEEIELGAQRIALEAQGAMEEIEKAARYLAKTSTMTYSEAYDELCRFLLRSEAEKRGDALEKLMSKLRKMNFAGAAPNRAARRKAQKARKRNYGKRKKK